MSILDTVSKLWQRKVVRFACVGSINTLTDLTLLNIFVFVFGLKVLIGNLFSATISIVMSYFLNHKIVFRSRYKLSFKLFLKFFIVTGLSILAVQSIIIYSFEHIFTLHLIRTVVGEKLSASAVNRLQVNSAKLVAVLFGMVWNFVLYQMVVFRHPEDSQTIDEDTVIPY